MSKIKEKVAYLQGLTKGLNVNEHSAEGKLLVNVVDVLYDIAEEMQFLHVGQEDLENYVETIDEDLTELEDEVFEGVYNDEMVELECPACHEVISFASNVLDEDDIVEVTCPSCGEVVYENTIEFEDEDDDVIHTTARREIHPGV
jgi:phage FluMu protein Com